MASEGLSAPAKFPFKRSDLLADFVMALLHLPSVRRRQTSELDVEDRPSLHFRERVSAYQRSIGGIWVGRSQHDVEHCVRITCSSGDGLVDVQLPKCVLEFDLWVAIWIPAGHGVNVPQRAGCRPRRSEHPDLPRVQRPLMGYFLDACSSASFLRARHAHALGCERGEHAR